MTPGYSRRAISSSDLEAAADGEAAWRGFDVVLKPTRSWVPLRLGDLWRYRDLLLFLVWRDLKIRYKQTVLGATWAVIQPFLTMLVFALFFGRLAGLAQRIEGGIPYPLFAFTALVPWTFFAYGLTHGSDSLVGSGHLISRIYFPRLVIPVAAILTGVVDMGLAFAALLGMMVWYRHFPTPAVVWLPAFLLLAVITALGVSLWLSALNVQFRDVRYTLGFLTQFWMVATPIAYPSSLLPEPWRTVYGLNPMAGVVEGFRWALLGTPPPGPLVFVSAAIALLLLLSGALYFRRMERSFADRI